MNVKINDKLLVICLLLLGLSASMSVAALTESTKYNTAHNNWTFDVFLDDTLIGFHEFDVVREQDRTVVSTTAEFDVKFLFLTVYDYKHRNKEVWSNNCLITLDSQTNDNGEILKVNLQKEGKKSFIKTSKNADSDEQSETPGPSYTEVSCVRSFAYWNPELIKNSALLNSQTGELIKVDFSLVGSTVYKLNDKDLQAKHYQLRGKDKDGVNIEIDLWYTNNMHWLALKSKLENGSYLRYQLSEKVAQ